MNINDWMSQFDNIQKTIERLNQRDNTGTPPREALQEAIEMLNTTIEELAATGEELRQQQHELVAAYAEAEAERERYRDLFDFAPDGYLVTDAKGKIREANQAASALLNIAPTQLDGRLLITFIAPDDQPRFLELLIRLKGGTPAEAWNVRMNQRGATPFSTSIVARPILDEQGAVVSIRWQIRDITAQVAQAQALRESEARLERNVAERTAELRASEERFRLVLQDSPVVVFHQDTDLRYTWIHNPAGGFNAEEIIGKTEHELLDQENADRLAAFKRRVFETGQGIREEIPWEHTNETLWFDMKLEPLRDQNGTIIGLTAVSTDITEYHREAERQRFLDEVSIPLITSQDPGSLLQQVAQKIAGRIADCCVFALPKGGDTMLHTVYHTDAARTAELRAWLEQDMREQAEQHPLRRALQGTQPVSLNQATSIAVGNEQPCAAQVSSATTDLPTPTLIAVSLIARGEVIGVLGLLNDQTERQYATQDLRLIEELARRVGLALDTTLSYDKALHARAEAEAALKMRDQVFGIISHDLKTPLTTIHGYIYLMRRKLETLEAADTDQLYRDSQKIDEAVTQMTQHINELLHVARLQAGEPIDFGHDPVDLTALVQRLAETHQQISEAHTIQVHAPPASGLTVRGERGHLERVFSNLLSNAVKYSPQGGTVEVILTQEERDSVRGAHIRVCDQGLGIPSADLPYLFEPFRRGSNVKEHTYGTGLGLVSVRYIVEQHGGTITVESQEGRGSTFMIWLPLHEDT